MTPPPPPSSAVAADARHGPPVNRWRWPFSQWPPWCCGWSGRAPPELPSLLLCLAGGLLLRVAIAHAVPRWCGETNGPETTVSATQGHGGAVVGGSGVAYTDLDYHVFTDAAACLLRNPQSPTSSRNDDDFYVHDDETFSFSNEVNSPYQRATYRYTPFLAAGLAVLGRLVRRLQRLYVTERSRRDHEKLEADDATAETAAVVRVVYHTSRYWFCLADALVGVLILQLRRRQRQRVKPLHAEPRRQTPPSQLSSSTSDEVHSWSHLFWDSASWLFHPLAIYICTRGSAEPLQVLLPVLLTRAVLDRLPLAEEKEAHRRAGPTSTITMTTTSTPSTTTVTLPVTAVLVAWVAGVLHGIAVHAKIYPVIYTVSYMTFLYQHSVIVFNTETTPSTTSRGMASSSPSSRLTRTHRLRDIATRGLAPLVFAITSFVTFLVVTFFGVYRYGPDAWEQAIRYHLTRVDHRHNYSLHYYWIYLARAMATTSASAATATESDGSLARLLPSLDTVGLLLLVPQATLLLYLSLTVARHHLSLAMFLQTYLFVAFNKVLTAQYFVWYLCLLPLCTHHFAAVRREHAPQKELSPSFSSLWRWPTIVTALPPQLLGATVGLIGGILAWLGTAYLLEIRGYALHYYNWRAAVVFFVAHTFLLRTLLQWAINTANAKRTDGTQKLVAN